jgi:branched-subunit amino acid transport protein
MTVWLIFFAVGAITLLSRLSFIYLHGKADFPSWFRLSLAYVPSAVLAAISAPGIAAYQGQLDLSFHNPRLWAGIIALLVAWRLRSVLATIVSGMGALWLLQWVLA